MDIKVNFDKLQDIVDDNIDSGDSLSSKLNEVERLISNTKHLLKAEKGKMNKSFYEKLDDLSDNIRGINNNYDDLAHGCKKYIKKMDVDEYIKNTSLDLKIIENETRGIYNNYNLKYNTELNSIRLKIKSLDSKVHDYKHPERSTKINNTIDSYVYDIMTEWKNTSKWEIETTTHVHKILKYHNAEYNETLNIASKITVSAAVAIGTTALAAFILPASATFLTVIAVESGITFVSTTTLETAKNYRDGSNTTEALVDVSISGVKDASISFAGASVGGMVSGVKKSPDFKLDSIDESIGKTFKFQPYLDDAVRNKEADWIDFGIDVNQKEYIFQTTKEAPINQLMSDAAGEVLASPKLEEIIGINNSDESFAIGEILEFLRQEEVIDINNNYCVDDSIVIQSYKEYIEEFYAS